jgi:DNA-binding NtrC family response regulator
MAPQYRGRLLEDLEACHSSVLVVGNCKNAARLLRTKPPVSVVISDFSLADGNWDQVLKAVTQYLPATQLVVCCRRQPAHGWTNILESGAYDVLIEPYEREDVRWMVEGAASQCNMRLKTSAS